MPRVTINIPESALAEYQDHALAHGMKLDQLFVDSVEARINRSQEMSEEEALRKLDEHLAPAIAQAERGEFSRRSVLDIIEDVKARHEV